MKLCSKCQQNKPILDFNISSKYKNNVYYYTYCKKCDKLLRKNRRLVTGKIKTSHDMPRIDLIGKRFGKLIVIKHNGKRKYKSHSRHLWLCKCDCGNEKSIPDNNLKQGHVNSCGCSQRLRGSSNPTYRGHNKISGTVWNKIKGCAKKRNVTFDITIEYVWQLFEEQDGKCALSDISLHLSESSKDHSLGKTTASLDRIDNTKGYIKDNVQWVHKDINRMKWAHNEKYFINLCSLVHNCQVVS